MKSVSSENQQIFHCSNCGGSFFEENGINRISDSLAHKLAEDKQTDEISTISKQCPKDSSPLSVLSKESIPPNVTLLVCPQCRGVFGFADDVLRFKQAQSVKINYFKLWQIPFPSLKSVVVAGFALFAAASMLTAIFRFQQQYTTPTQAEDIVRNIHITSSNRYVFVTFRTQNPLTSTITFIDKTTNTTIEKIISNSPVTLHHFTTGDIEFKDEMYYQITVTDRDGKQVKTKEVELKIK